MPLFQRPSGEKTRQRVRLVRYAPELKFTSLVPGVDNIRHDVYLSPRLVSFTAQHVFQLLVKYSAAGSLLEDSAAKAKPTERNEFKRLVQDVLLAALSQARSQQNQELDLLANLALFKYLGWEMQRQYGVILQQGKNKLKKFEGPKHESNLRVLQLRQTFSDFQTQKKIILRLVGTELQRAVNEVQVDTVRKTRESFFGPESGPWYSYFSNPLLFTDNGRDDFIHLEKYVMSGNFERDPDRYGFIEEWLRWFFAWVDEVSPEAQELARHKERQKELAAETEALKQAQSPQRKSGLGQWFGAGSAGKPAVPLSPAELSRRIEALLQQMLEEAEMVQVLDTSYRARVDELLNAPENAEEMFGVSRTEQQIAELRRRGAPRQEISALEEQLEVQRYLLDELYQSAQKAGLLPFVVAAYEAARIYTEFCPPINPQNLKQALLAVEERKKVADMIAHYKLPESRLATLEDTAARVRAQSTRDLRGLLARYIGDYLRHHRDARLLAVFQGICERLNLAFEDRTRELSRINGTLYQFLLPNEEQPVSERVTGHAILKADVRNSSRLTADLLARGLNPASHFSLNFYEPLNRILPRYGAEKVFIEGDAVILALFEREGEAGHAVALACGLAREMIEIVRLYNSKGEGSGLPPLEIGIGICWRSAAPLYLLDGENRIMISDALNLSDRLSGCSKIARRILPQNNSLFNVYNFQTITVEAAGAEIEDILLRYNVNGICLNEEAFEKLRREISLTPVEVDLPLLWGQGKIKLHCGSVPLSQGVFQRLVVREALVPFVDGRTLSFQQYTLRPYFEICTTKPVYDQMETLLSNSVTKGA